MKNQVYSIEDKKSYRIYKIKNKEYKTIYSKKVIELLIERKGTDRTVQYLFHKEKRCEFIKPLINHLELAKKKNLNVLYIGCSSGHNIEFLNDCNCISEIYTYDVDKIFVEITKLKKEELNLHKVKKIDCFLNDESRNLPYKDNFFDIIIAMAVVEHLPFENRYLYIDNYYKKLKLGGLICFWDTPNRYFPLETHSIGLPFIHRLSPQNAYIYAKLMGKLKNVPFTAFTQPGTGWRNSSYYECIPKTMMINVKDISEEIGYGYTFFKKHHRSLKAKLLRPFFFFLKLYAKILNLPPSFFLPYLNIVFQKVHNYEK